MTLSILCLYDKMEVRKGGAIMQEVRITIQDASEIDPNLLRMLDRGLEDIEANRTLPHEEAMAEVRRIRAAPKV